MAWHDHWFVFQCLHQHFRHIKIRLENTVNGRKTEVINNSAKRKLIVAPSAKFNQTKWILSKYCPI